MKLFDLFLINSPSVSICLPSAVVRQFCAGVHCESDGRRQFAVGSFTSDSAEPEYDYRKQHAEFTERGDAQQSIISKTSTAG